MIDNSKEFSGVRCRVCGGGGNSHLCQTFNEHSQTRWLENYRCNDCGSVFVGNQIQDRELAEAYASLDEAAYYAEVADASAKKFSGAARELAGLAGFSADLLDIGGGDGAFLRALRAQGFSSLSMHEIPGSKIADTPGLLRRCYRDFDYATLPSSAFDVVTLMDVMEHVPDPGATLAAARRVLRPGGVLYLHTPVVTRLDRVMHAVQKLPALGAAGRTWQRARTSIFHLQNYTPRSLSLLMQRHGFEIVRLDCRNELSWPLERYVRVYLAEKKGLPKSLIPIVAFLLSPIARSGMNANKGVLIARARG